MLTRLTALLLSLCIALPMCWCCVAVSASPQAEVASCCARKQHAASDHHSGQPKDQGCPCARHEASRDFASTIVKAPAPALKLLAAPVWHLFSTTSFQFQISSLSAPRHDHGPPLYTSPPLYARHCALLI
ncbi:hypothetical protein [Prosthecobacter vanneervenii]|uniref:Secreted protein n=1 Tax=Prosthecobacter vanneervenii TaxID=48466 RepID=A0A7W7YG01_9BACT|nr:hypothetical protein [Prosthecobacter vanneervenii]MBB5035516.1 hypothetical protein [Prosthecobacter vanneervenii]